MHISKSPMRLAIGAACTLAVGASASAQFNNQWVSFTQDNSMLSAGTISDNNIETDLDWVDLDQDGWIDLVVVRKQPYTSAGKRTNLLLMNESGVLTDRTSLYATASSVGGDNGFNTATNDRDVNHADFDGNGWMDLVTATTLSDGNSKAIGHPRLYMNQGESAGSWNGLYYDEPRIPQLFSYSTNQPENPRFCSVAVGDLTNDGAPEIWFGDYDSSGAGGVGQPSGLDLNDRLLVNDGSGFFTDESQSRLSSDMLKSAFGMASVIEDMNLDGFNDIVKDTALNPPQDVRVIYNNPSNPGFFSIQDKFHTNAPYHVNTGDLNNDGRPDVVISDDGSDRYRYNTGTDGLGRVIWGTNKTFQFLTGSDDGFGSNNLIADLDMDGWNDALICDVDVDINGGQRRIHIYHNPGGAVGDQITLKEERQSSSSSGWIGVVGMSTNNMTGAHDVAVFDIDNDGDNDMVLSRFAGTYVWRNNTDPIPEVCQTDIGFGGPGSSLAKMCGTGLGTGQTSSISLRFAAHNAPALLVVGLQNLQVPIFGGTLVPADMKLLLPYTTAGTGVVSTAPINGGHAASPTVYFQWVIVDGAQAQGFDFSNAIQAQWMP